ncbi:MAG: SDR family oxidoreductase [Acidimicrobiales bacterium]|nr:SDR family oxidoreductase [Acidimicrobiales bacterium]
MSAPSGTGRLAGKVAVVVGAGQTPGETIGNGRAVALLFAREGARVFAVDRDPASARQTCDLIAGDGGVAEAFEADVRSEDDCRRAAEAAVERFGRIDVLHNNVGVGAGDGGALDLTVESWDRIHQVDLRGMWLTCKHVLPVMRAQEAGAVVNVSSAAAVCSVPIVAYKTAKAGVNALTQELAMENAAFGVRVNAVMPGLIDTPMAVDAWAAALGMSRDEIRAERDRLVPLRRRMGTAWDVAHAALYLASDEADFVTGVVLPVDGGQCARVG